MDKVYEQARKEFSNVWFQFILDHPDTPWNYYLLSTNPNVTQDIIQQHQHLWNVPKMSDLAYIVLNALVTWELIQNNSDNCTLLSGDPNITWNIVQQHPEKDWCYEVLSMNEMPTWKNAFIREKMQDHFRTSALKEELMQTLFHPKNIYKFADWGFDE